MVQVEKARKPKGSSKIYSFASVLFAVDPFKRISRFTIRGRLPGEVPNKDSPEIGDIGKIEAT